MYCVFTTPSLLPSPLIPLPPLSLLLPLPPCFLPVITIVLSGSMSYFVCLFCLISSSFLRECRPLCSVVSWVHNSFPTPSTPSLPGEVRGLQITSPLSQGNARNLPQVLLLWKPRLEPTWWQQNTRDRGLPDQTHTGCRSLIICTACFPECLYFR